MTRRRTDWLEHVARRIDRWSCRAIGLFFAIGIPVLSMHHR